MKDLIAKLKSDANVALGAIWLHIDAQSARIAELESEVTRLSASWRGDATVADALEERIAELEAQIAASADTDKLREALPYNKSLIFNMSRRFAVVSAFGDQSEPERFVFDSNSLMRYVEEIGSFLIAQRDYNMDMALQAPVREVPGWQPIETAPKDGTRVLLQGTPYAMLYAETKTLVGYFNKGWWMDTASLSHVTHWMPLPAAPVQQEGE